MASGKYVSCIRIAGCPILPPLITESRRQELIRDRISAQQVEENLATRRRLETLRSNIEELDLHCSEHIVSSHSQSSEDSTDVSLDTTAQLLQYIEHALSDVSNKEEVQMLQTKVFEELQEHDFENKKIHKSGSTDTLNNLESISLNDEKCQVQCETINVPLLEIKDDSPECDTVSSEQFTPTKLIRSNSYVLDSPSPSVLKFLKSLTQGDNTSIDDSRSEINKVSKNLNKMWGEGDCGDWLHNLSDLDTSLTKSEDVCRNLLNESDKQNVEINANVSIFSNVKSEKDRNDNSIVPSIVIHQSSFKQKHDSDLYNRTEQAALIIQAYVRGYLVRRLLKTVRVIELKNTIKDSLVYALALHTEQNVSSADVNLHMRLIRQVTAACYELHSIFFEWTIKERMMLISQDRIKSQTPRLPRALHISKLERKRSVGSRTSGSSNGSVHNHSVTKMKSLNSLVKSSPILKSPLSASSIKYKPWK